MSPTFQTQLDAGLAVLQSLAGQALQIERIAATVRDALLAGHTLFTCGNGGSATDAQHLERNADLLKAGQILKLFTSDQIAATTPFRRCAPLRLRSWTATSSTRSPTIAAPRCMSMSRPCSGRTSRGRPIG